MRKTDREMLEDIRDAVAGCSREDAPGTIAWVSGQVSALLVTMHDSPDEKMIYCLQDSHRLLRHYSDMLNMHDGGQRTIPESLDDWIERCWGCRESNSGTVKNS